MGTNYKHRLNMLAPSPKEATALSTYLDIAGVSLFFGRVATSIGLPIHCWHPANTCSTVIGGVYALDLRPRKRIATSGRVNLSPLSQLCTLATTVYLSRV